MSKIKDFFAPPDELDRVLAEKLNWKKIDTKEHRAKMFRMQAHIFGENGLDEILKEHFGKPINAEAKQNKNEKIT